MLAHVFDFISSKHTLAVSHAVPQSKHRHSVPILWGNYFPKSTGSWFDRWFAIHSTFSEWRGEEREVRRGEEKRGEVKRGEERRGERSGGEERRQQRLEKGCWL